jgi:ATP-binding cassette, subfamily B, bacterial
MSSDQQALPVMLRNCAAQLGYLIQTLRLVWASAKGWTTAWATLLVIQGLLPVATVYLTRLLVDSLVASIRIGASWASVRPTLILAALMAGVLLLAEFLQIAGDWIRTAQAELVQDHINALVHEKSIAVDLAFYESPEYYDRLHRARSDASNRPLALLESAGALLQNSLTFLAMALVLLPYGAWLPLILVVSVLPAFYAVVRSNWRYHQWWTQTTAHRRWAQYYDLMLTQSPVAAELRLFGLGFHFQLAYQALRRELRTERLRLLKRQSLARLGAGATALVISGTAIGWMLWRALQGWVTLGDLALFYQAFSTAQSLMRSLLGNAGQIYTNSLFLGNLFEFLNLKPEVTDARDPFPAPLDVKKDIRFRQVTFYYPRSERPALQDFTLTIPAGKIVAIVGPNGAGKSTLVKLLCRFYDPQAGRIELDEVDLRALPIQDLRSLITVLFQWPVPYHATAAQNIAYGDLLMEPNAAEIEAAARAAGAHELIARLPRGYDTLLGKWFVDGNELSAGEWQRIALARAFLRRAPIILLDEPTSSMDSWAEADWFERFRALAAGHTAIVITHRFTIARRADVIHVMDSGRIVESGSHEELLTQGGLYAQSWTAQMRASSTVEPLNTAHSGLGSQIPPRHTSAMSEAR